MRECICSSCEHLKSIVDESAVDKDAVDENGIFETCEFGFPAETCSECEVEGCELTCEHYAREREVDDFVISKCAKCGQEVKHISKTDEEGSIYCVTCYLDK